VRWHFIGGYIVWQSNAGCDRKSGQRAWGCFIIQSRLMLKHHWSSRATPDMLCIELSFATTEARMAILRFSSVSDLKIQWYYSVSYMVREDWLTSGCINSEVGVPGQTAQVECVSGLEICYGWWVLNSYSIRVSENLVARLCVYYPGAEDFCCSCLAVISRIHATRRMMPLTRHPSPEAQVNKG